MFSQWPIRKKLWLGCGLLLVIMATLSWSGFYGLYAYRNLVRSLSDRVAELPLAGELSRRVSDLRVTLKDVPVGAEFPGDQAERPLPGERVSLALVKKEFDSHLKAVRTILDHYRDHLLETEEDHSRLGVSNYEWDALAKIDSTLSRIEGLTPDSDWMLDPLSIEQLHASLLELQTLAGELPGHLQRNIVEFKADVRGQYRSMIVLTWLTSLSALALLVIFVRWAYQWIFQPLSTLVAGSRKVAGGDFGHRIQLPSQDEMAELGRALNDMTSRFQDIRDDLDRQVRERTKQVVRSEQLASVGFLAAGVAHEINNPLASIAMCAESLEDRLNGLVADDDPRRALVRNYLEMIQTEAFRCKEITERLLDFSRLGDVKRQPADLREIVQGVIDMIGHLGKYQQKKIEFAASGATIANVNPQEMKQVVLNLLTNALDSLDSGGLVVVTLGAEREQVVLDIVDNGCGMSPEVLRHLYEPFFTRRRGGQGTGLGLSITYRIIADHQGQIEASSDGPGRGSRFRVTLPLAVRPTELRTQEVPHRNQAA